jgi:hypothetical protein
MAGRWFVGLRFFSIHKLNEVTRISDAFFTGTTQRVDSS